MVSETQVVDPSLDCYGAGGMQIWSSCHPALHPPQRAQTGRVPHSRPSCLALEPNGGIVMCLNSVTHSVQDSVLLERLPGAFECMSHKNICVFFSVCVCVCVCVCVYNQGYEETFEFT